MTEPTRKPLARAPMESLVGKTVRLTPTVWERVEAQARLRGRELLVMTRLLIEHALIEAEQQVQVEASLGNLATTVAGSPGTRRF